MEGDARTDSRWLGVDGIVLAGGGGWFSLFSSIPNSSIAFSLVAVRLGEGVASCAPVELESACA